MNELPEPSPRPKTSRDRVFFGLLGIALGAYASLLLAMVVAQATYTTPARLVEVLSRPDVLASVRLTLLASTGATIAAITVGLPVAYTMSRFQFRGRSAVDAVLDLPNVMPPLVLGISLLVLFQFFPLRLFAASVVYQVPAVFIAQFVVAAAYAIPILRSALVHTDGRSEQVALTLGCSRWSAFWRVTVPEIRHGIVQAAAMAWARCIGTFGPLLVFAGATRFKTEVLATTIYMELNSGDLAAAVAASLVLIGLAAMVLIALRLFGDRHPGETTHS